MECVLGVSLTPTTVRMVLVEGAAADGATVDHDSVDIAVVDGPDELISAIVGTRESSVASGHRLITTGVAWTDRASAAQLRKALRARGVADVVLVSELHAAGALAQAVGRTVGDQRTALMFLEGDTASLSVVDTATGAVVGVQTRRLQPADVMADLREMIVSLERLADQPDGVFVVGSGADIAEAKSQISTVTALPVHAPDDADLALARGAALAAAQAPRYEATTVGLTPARDTDDTGALATQLADAGYMAPLGYSQVDDDFDDGFGDDFLDGLDGESEELDPTFEDEDRKPFLLVGSALTSVFVVGVVALVISLAVSIRPAAEQHPAPNSNVTQGTQSAGLATPRPPAPAQAPPVETIQEPVPVAPPAPRTVYVTPAPQAPAPVAAPAPVVAPAPAPAAPIPEAPAPVVPAAPAPPAVIPVPVFIPPVSVVPPQLLPPILRPRPRGGTGQPYPGSPSSQSPSQSTSPTTGQVPTETASPQSPTQTQVPQTQVPQTQVPQTQVPQTAADVPTQAPSAPQTTMQVPSQSGSSSGGSSSGSSSSGSSSSNTLWPLFGGR